MTSEPKELTVRVEDQTQAELLEKITVHHLSELGDNVKDAIEDFVKLNEGAVIPPVSIEVREVKGSAGGN